MNKATTLLFSEHEIIVSAISIISETDNYINTDEDRYEEIIKELLYFFRNYADNYHHRKEEQILFPEMVKRNELLGDSAIKEMFDNHEDFRLMLKYIEAFIESGDYNGSSRLLHQYAEYLLNHIAIEDEEVFQMTDTLFSPDELDNLYFRFEDIDNELGKEEKLNMEQRIIKIIEKR